MPEIASLVCHPATPCRALAGIAVTIERLPTGGLRLAYRLAGSLARLRLPAPMTPGPADGLWQHTCCEAFIGLADGAYREFNFSPSGQWALYDFSGYRQRSSGATPAGTPGIVATSRPDALLVTVDLPPTLLPPGASALGLTVVVEEADGDRSYWALAHAAPQPDFHRRESFLAALPA